MAQIAKKMADVPTARPGFDSIGITAPIMMQMNPTGKWESSKPESVDEEQLTKLVNYLVKSKAVNVAQSYCSQCAAENKNTGGGGKSKFVPIIMMPVFSANDCPFDINAEAKKMHHEPKHKETMNKVHAQPQEESEQKGLKKRVFQLQRLTDFDLLSQW